MVDGAAGVSIQVIGIVQHDGLQGARHHRRAVLETTMVGEYGVDDAQPELR